MNKKDAKKLISNSKVFAVSCGKNKLIQDKLLDLGFTGEKEVFYDRPFIMIGQTGFTYASSLSYYETSANKEISADFIISLTLQEDTKSFRIGDMVKLHGISYPYVIKEIINNAYLLEGGGERIYRGEDELVLYTNDDVKPKFSIGNMVRHKYCSTPCTIKDIKFINNRPVYQFQENGNWIMNEEELSLYDEPEPFDKVLVRNSDSDIWCPSLYGYYSPRERKYYCCGHIFTQCIKYSGNEDLCGTNKKIKE